MTTMAEVRRVTWSIFWKWTLLAFAGGFVSGFVIGAIMGAAIAVVYGPAAVATGSWPTVIRIVTFSAGLAVGFLTLNYLLARSIGKEFGGKKLMLVDAFAAGEN